MNVKVVRLVKRIPVRATVFACRVWANRGPLLPIVAVTFVHLLFYFLGHIAGLDNAKLPKPLFYDYVPYPYISDHDMATVMAAGLWWLGLTASQWVLGVVVLILCVRELIRASEATGRADTIRLFAGIVLAVAGALSILMVVTWRHGDQVVLLPIEDLAAVVSRISPGFLRLAQFNVALMICISCAVVVTNAFLIRSHSHRGSLPRQMEALTTVMYGAAFYLAVAIAGSVSFYRLCVVMLDGSLRQAMLRIVPGVGLVGGLYTSLVLVAAYGSACLCLQHRFESELSVAAGSGEAASRSPMSTVAEQWPKLAGLLTPLLPGAVALILQSLGLASN